MANKKILVVLGGNSREREISIKTGKACTAAIKRLGYKVEIFDPKQKSFFEIKKNKSNIIFNALHGEEGEDGYAQSFFEYSKISPLVVDEKKIPKKGGRGSGGKKSELVK